MNKIREISFGTEWYRQALALRYGILRAPLGLVFGPEELAGEVNDVHFVALDQSPTDREEQVVGCLLLRSRGPREFQMRQVAVAENQQRRGVGRQLVVHVERWLRERACDRVILHAREQAREFYRRLGYEEEGRPFVELGIVHSLMTKRLSTAKTGCRR